MRLRSALTGLCAVGLVLAGTPAIGADDALDLALTVTTADGATQAWSASDVVPGAGAELVGGAGGCAVRASVDVDPAARTITLAVTRPAGAVDVSLAVTGPIGGLVPVSPGASGELHVTVTPEIALVAWHAQGAECTTSTAVVAYVAPGEPLPAEGDALSRAVPQVPGGPVAPAAPAAPASTPTGKAPAARAVTADPSFTG